LKRNRSITTSTDITTPHRLSLSVGKLQAAASTVKGSSRRLGLLGTIYPGLEFFFIYIYFSRPTQVRSWDRFRSIILVGKLVYLVASLPKFAAAYEPVQIKESEALGNVFLRRIESFRKRLFV
jgi:hypothetical protein